VVVTSGGSTSSGEDSVKIISGEDKFFVHSCLVPESLTPSHPTTHNLALLATNGETASEAVCAAGLMEQSSPPTTAADNHVGTAGEGAGGGTPTSRPQSDDRMEGIWKLAAKDPKKMRVYKRKLAVQHIYPAAVGVLETSPSDALEFVFPAPALHLLPNDSSRGSLGRGESYRSLLSTPTMSYDSIDERSTLLRPITAFNDDRSDMLLPSPTAEDDDESESQSKSSKSIPRCFLTLTHTDESPDSILFKIKTNQPKRYRVHPDHQGIIAPGDSKMVSIRLLDKYRKRLTAPKKLRRDFRNNRDSSGGVVGSVVGVGGEDVESLTTNNTMSTTTKRQSLRCDDRFFVQYCTVDDVFLREWPNLNLPSTPLGVVGGNLMAAGEDTEEVTESKREHRAMSGLWNAAERSASIQIHQKRLPVRHFLEYEEEEEEELSDKVAEEKKVKDEKDVRDEKGITSDDHDNTDGDNKDGDNKDGDNKDGDGTVESTDEEEEDGPVVEMPGEKVKKVEVVL